MKKNVRLVEKKNHKKHSGLKEANVKTVIMQNVVSTCCAIVEK